MLLSSKVGAGTTGGCGPALQQNHMHDLSVGAIQSTRQFNFVEGGLTDAENTDVTSTCSRRTATTCALGSRCTYMLVNRCAGASHIYGTAVLLPFLAPVTVAPPLCRVGRSVHPMPQWPAYRTMPLGTLHLQKDHGALMLAPFSPAA
jgi:hypothetical protein